MFITYGDIQDWEQNYQIEKLKDENEKIILTRIFDRPDFEAKLSTIELETINKCNNDCSFCPVSTGNDIRKTLRMSDQLFKKIIDNLEQMQYDGVLSLFSNNEPLIDDRLVPFLTYAREKLPDATLCIFTNGILLNEELYSNLVELLDYLVIDNYNDEMMLNSNIKSIEEKNIEEKNCRVHISVRKKTQVLLNRGGLSPNNQEKCDFESPCILPYIQMVIRPDGKVSRCCQDAYGNETMGDLSVQTIQEVWQGEKYQFYRKMMFEGKRGCIDYCKQCDVKGLYNLFPNKWLHLYYEQIYDMIYEKWKQHRKIAFCGVKEANYMIYTLNTMGVTSEYSSLKEDIRYYAENGYFLVLDQVEEETFEYFASKNLKAGNDFVLCQYSLSAGRQAAKDDEQKNHMRQKVLQASKENQLIMFGAGANCKILMEAFRLKPAKIVDNYRGGEIWNDCRIDWPKDITVNENMVFLVTPTKYVEIVQQLNDMGISSRQIMVGSFLMDLL